jgi:DNA-binding transcriptional MerR regulator/methanogenic corrinoid protein MtbC1
MKEYNINITSKLTGLSAHTLRAWEKRYQIVTPKRNSSGHRLYSDDEVIMLRRLNDLCNHGHSISQLQDKDLSELKELIEVAGIQDHHETKGHQLKSDPPLAESSLNNLLLALEEFRLDVVSHEFYNIKMKVSHRELALHIISPLMQIIGRRVLEKKFSIAQEHALSSILKFHLGQFIYRGQTKKKGSRELFIMTTPENDFHEFGILLASLLCTHYEQNFFFLGPNLPAEALVHAANSLEATHIIIGTTNASSNSPLDNYLSDVITGIGQNKTLMVGGKGYFNFSKFKLKKNFEYFPSLDHLDQFLKNHKSEQY